MNYNKVMEKTIKLLKKEEWESKPRLLLHSCCGPCSTSVIQRLWPYFHLSVFFYNSNITDVEEYKRRRDAQIKYIHIFNELNNNSGSDTISFMEGEYDPYTFLAAVENYKDYPEGGMRCNLCFELRLRETATVAEREKFDFFTTTLSVSPMKDVDKLNEVGMKVEKEMCSASKYLISDFKKKDGYKRSIELSKENELYRQHYCGCIYSISSDIH